jgi:hypothetical protein
LFIYFWAPCWHIYFIHVCFVCVRIPAGSAVPSSRTAFLPLSIPNPNPSLIFLLLNTRLLLLLQVSKSLKVEHPVDCVVTSFVQNPLHNPVVSRTTVCSDSHSRWDT